MIVSFASVFTLVLDTRLEPGSLKAMWPSGPIPDREEEKEWGLQLFNSGQKTNLKRYFHHHLCALLTSNKQLNPPGSCNLLLEGVALCLQVGGIAVEDVGVLCFYIYVLEEVIPHEGVVALRMISRKSYK